MLFHVTSTGTGAELPFSISIADGLVIGTEVRFRMSEPSVEALPAEPFLLLMVSVILLSFVQMDQCPESLKS